MPSPILDERDLAHTGGKACSFRTDDIAVSQEFRRTYAQRTNVITAEDMPFERSADGSDQASRAQQAQYTGMLR